MPSITPAINGVCRQTIWRWQKKSHLLRGMNLHVSSLPWFEDAMGKLLLLEDMDEQQGLRLQGSFTTHLHQGRGLCGCLGIQCWDCIPFLYLYTILYHRKKRWVTSGYTELCTRQRQLCIIMTLSDNGSKMQEIWHDA